ncbi:cytochrome P450 2J5-like [Pristis pectinata]|uniref:cytochrome P450 2J5-like n=1 Tax=Pristis pectinata TaxID=685728 RepID=UPI00223CD000|nr:cytochrome P450 2J5-like [Pristis pectinata]
MEGMELASGIAVFHWLDLKVLLIFLLGFLLVSHLIQARTPNQLPPGPSSWSPYGNIFTSDRKSTHIKLNQLTKTYGNICTLKIFWTPIIVLSGFQTIQEALIQHSREFAGRPKLYINNLLTKGQGIISAPYGKSWKQQRRFTLTIFRNFGLGKIAFEKKILEEAQYLTETLKAILEGQPVDPHPIITSAVSNVTCSVVLGKRFHYEDKTFTRLIKLFDEALALQSGVWIKVCSALPFICHLPGPHQRIFENQTTIEGIFQDFIKQHRETLNSETIRDYIDAYLLETEKKPEADSFMLDGNLLFNIYDLFLAGTETTTTTLRWGLLYMMAYPDIQEKCQKEVDEVIGRSRAPSMDDRANMPYVNAVIHEIQRFGNIVPFSVAHATTQDTRFMGYTIKKDTLVLLNLYSALTEEGQWKHPHQFNPENFLNDSGEFFKPDAFIPFSMGLRACLGEKLAKMELFLFFTSLLQHLEFHWPEKTSSPNLEGLYNIVLAPHPYKMHVRCRKAPSGGL